MVWGKHGKLLVAFGNAVVIAVNLSSRNNRKFAIIHLLYFVARITVLIFNQEISCFSWLKYHIVGQLALQRDIYPCNFTLTQRYQALTNLVCV